MKKFLFIVCTVLSLKAFPQNTQSFFFGRTAGKLPFLEYGIGDDRLGGAKMTYLDTNILVKVIDSFKTDYKIELSKNHTAYIDKKSVVKEITGITREHLTSSWKVYGDSLFDYVTVSLDEKLPYRSVQQINPSRVVVEIFGVENNTNWITQLNSTKEIKNAWYEQQEDDVMKVIIDLKHKQHWGHSIFYEGNKLVIKIKRQPQKPELRYLTIAVDAGHGGDNMGATGVTTNIQEKNYTLLIAKQLQAALIKKKARVIMTREKDTSLSMVERNELIKNQNPNMLISIHLNSTSRDSVQGVSTYYRYIGFRPLSVSILNKMLQLKLKEFGNVGAFNFSLSGPTDYPNCLVEVAFLSNKEDEKKILSPAFHKAVAKKIVEGIEEFLKNL
ncbi:MAG: N-acetylmuramoyl-L-alanine amidase [Chitinophagaceae bacterium]|nr:N-acetylmuramoyl-L-alanine amidase [Chitinophagaceae bacterium]MDB5221915.1 N-acetylmuramoyl-L-alanine amidase [Chitinophagaceae bacterium]